MGKEEEAIDHFCADLNTINTGPIRWAVSLDFALKESFISPWIEVRINFLMEYAIFIV